MAVTPLAPVNPESVDVLLAHTVRLAEAERDRTRHADTRAGGLAIVSNGLLAIGATLSPRISHLHGDGWLDAVVFAVYSAALVMLLLAGVGAAISLRSTSAPAFRLEAFQRYLGAYQSADPVDLRRNLLASYVAELASERITYDAKIRRLQVGYRLLAAGLVAIVATAITLALGHL